MLVSQIQLVQFQFGAVLDSLGQGLLKWGNVPGLGFWQIVCGFDLNVGQLRSDLFGNHGLDHFRLLQVVGLRHDQLLLVAGKFGFCLHHVEWGHGADLNLFLVVLHKFLRIVDGGLRHTNLVTVCQQRVVGIQNLGNGSNHLLAKFTIRHVQVISCNADINPIGPTAEPAEQMLVETYC